MHNCLTRKSVKHQERLFKSVAFRVKKHILLSREISFFLFFIQNNKFDLNNAFLFFCFRYILSFVCLIYFLSSQLQIIFFKKTISRTVYKIFSYISSHNLVNKKYRDQCRKSTSNNKKSFYAVLLVVRISSFIQYVFFSIETHNQSMGK